jgi:polyribonucleotide nucleotidyltransferase
MIKAMTETAEVGKVYMGRVSKIMDFGAFVEILPGQDGMCHISELSDQYVKNVTDVVKMGDVIQVKVISVDDQGRIKLSRKAVLKGESAGASGKKA